MMTNAKDMIIYADYNSAAPLHPAVKDYMQARLETGPFANHKSLHNLGYKINSAMEECRKQCAHMLGCNADQILFNSGATEGIKTIFQSVFLQNQNTKKRTFAIASTEHNAIFAIADYYCKNHGYSVESIPVDLDGLLDQDTLENVLKNKGEELALVCVMPANNETGVIQDIQSITKLCSTYNVPLFSDTTQYIGKISDFDFSALNIDFAVTSAYKIGAPFGTGILIAKDPAIIQKIFTGTGNYLGIEALTVALHAFKKDEHKLIYSQMARDKFERQLKHLFPQVVIIGENAARIAGTTMIAFPGIHGQAIQIELESRNIFVSTSSACSDNEPQTSHVLKAMGIDDSTGRGAIRISIGLDNPGSVFDQILVGLDAAIKKLSI